MHSALPLFLSVPRSILWENQPKSDKFNPLFSLVFRAECGAILDDKISTNNQYRVVEFPINSLNHDDDLEWAERCEYWVAELNRRSNKFSQKRKEHLPLILAGHGVRMNIDNGTLVIRNGFTHHPQKPEQWRYFRGGRYLPSRIIMLDGDGYLTFDVLAWLSEQGIPLIQLDWMGSVTTVVGASGYSADPKTVERQLAAKRQGSLKMAVWILAEKLEASATTLKGFDPRTATIEKALEYFERELRNLSARPPKTISGILGIEGGVGSKYFGAWWGIPLRWTGTGRRPIPADWRRIGPRISNYSRNRNAVHPINAMLNYAYAVLENLLRVQIVAMGLDPTVGYLHASYEDKHPLVFDLMEPLRPVVDRKILQFVQQHTFTPGDFTLTARGVCRLNPQMARNVVKAVDLGKEVEKLSEKLIQRIDVAARVGSGRIPDMFLR